MLARQEQEREIITVPLRKKEILEITSVKLSVYDSKNIKLSVPVFNVRSITPIKKDKIKIQFYEPKILSNGNTIQKRKYLEYKLEKSDFTAMHVCRKILKEYERLNSRSANRYGFLLLHGWEHIVSVYHDTKTNKGTGLLYVTNAGLVLETDEGVIFDVPYQYVELVTDHKKKVRIVWREPWNSLNNFRFDLQMGKKTDRDVVRIQIRDAFVRYRKKIGHEFIELEKKYESISYDEIYNLINTRNPEYQRYLLLHVGHTFGYVSPKFETSDSQNIVTCKLAGYDLDIISDISEEEAVQRKESLDFSVKTAQGNKKWKELNDVQLEMESQCSDKDEFVKLSKSKEYKKIISAKDDLKINHGIPGLDNVDYWNVADDLHNANSLRATDARNLLIYKKWIQDVPLIDCTDEYDDSWMSYLLEKLNCEHGKNRAFGGSIIFDVLKEEMKIRDRNMVTLSSFVAPENIPTEDIYNNCWHDRANKIWYVYDDNLSERLQNNAISDPDHSQAMCGRRVWGFPEDQVVMFEGFPSLYLKSSHGEDTLEYATVSRTTGDRIDYLETEMRYFILPIIREKDITEQFMDRFGSFTLQTEALLYNIVSSGGGNYMTPKMYHFYAKKYDFADITIAERTRRAFFVSQIGGWFSAQSKVGVDDVDVSNTCNTLGS